MAPRDNSHEGTATPDPVEKGFATLATLRIGVKAMVEKNGEPRKAEILSITTRKGKPAYYVHYEEFNKRLDEWITADRLDLDQEVEWPAPEKSDKKKSGPNDKSKAQPAALKNKKQKSSKADREISAAPEQISVNVPGKAPKAPEAGGKENQETLTVTELVPETPQADEDMADVVDLADAAAMAKAAPAEPISREDEIEKLRTSGSMTQNQAGTPSTFHLSGPPVRPSSAITQDPTEISRVRNLSRIQMGQFEVEPWYFSPYPAEFSDADIVHICEFCLNYYDEYKPFERHRSKCQLVHPPGNEIYRDDYISFFEIDGRRQRTWCRNLCLLSKLFLDHKTLYYDVDPFLFYCMCTRDEHGCHLVGYFSKEKDSAEGYNLACILTLPQYQRKGFGRLLIAFSYELSKREGKLGSPEKPLSDLGLLGYRAYWQETVVDLLMEGKSEMSVEDLGAASAMTTTDVLHTLQNLNLLRYSKNSHLILLTDAVVKQREKQKEKERIKGKHHIDSSKLIWKPPVFTASARTWNW